LIDFYFVLGWGWWVVAASFLIHVVGNKNQHVFLPFCASPCFLVLTELRLCQKITTS